MTRGSPSARCHTPGARACPRDARIFPFSPKCVTAGAGWPRESPLPPPGRAHGFGQGQVPAHALFRVATELTRARAGETPHDLGCGPPSPRATTCGAGRDFPTVPARGHPAWPAQTGRPGRGCREEAGQAHVDQLPAGGGASGALGPISVAAPLTRPGAPGQPAAASRRGRGFGRARGPAGHVGRGAGYK